MTAIPRRSRAVIVGAMSVLLAMSLIPPAHATMAFCSFNAKTGNLVLFATNVDRARIYVTNGQIRYVAGTSETSCGSTQPTVDNVDDINFSQSGPAGSEFTLTIVRPRTFAPGATLEAGTSEIEFQIDLGAETISEVQLRAGPHDETFFLGPLGVNHNRDGDRDMFFVNEIRRLEVHGGSGHDTVDGRGTHGTGTHYERTIVFFGGGGADLFHGGLVRDGFAGQPGRDVGEGSSGSDVLFGGDDHDTLRGGDGQDDLVGHLGDDVLRGGPMGDLLNGGPGNDDCDGGGGDDQLESC